jgi:hypothetical protein
VPTMTRSTVPALSAEEAFALVLETACEDFENLLDLIDGQLKVVAVNEERRNAHRAL